MVAERGIGVPQKNDKRLVENWVNLVRELEDAERIERRALAHVTKAQRTTTRLRTAVQKAAKSQKSGGAGPKKTRGRFGSRS
jgi:hypothetical protein